MTGFDLQSHIRELLPGAKFIVLGDEKQLKSQGHSTTGVDYIAQGFDRKNYQKVITHLFTTDHRAKNCRVLRKLKTDIRDAMDENKSEIWIFENLIKPQSHKISENMWI